MSSRRRILVAGAAIAGVALVLTVIGFLVVGLVTTESALSTAQSGLSTADSAVTALTNKSSAQTKTIASQQKTIASQQKTIATFTSRSAAELVAGQRKLLAYFDSFAFVLVDVLEGNHTAIQRDIRILNDLLSPP